MKKTSLSILMILIISLCCINHAECQEMTPKQIYQRLSPGVVLIMSTHGGTTGSLGTGSIISESGMVITNHHVIFDQSRNRFYKL